MNDLPEHLCLSCALCCNGVLFKDVQLQKGDDGLRLRRAGLPVKTRRGKELFPQPCVALDGCRCGCYAERPARCRDFECVLFQAVAGGKMRLEEGLRVVRMALQRAERVRQLLRRLGDEEEERALSLRFKRLSQRLPGSGMDEETAEVYADLTLAVHDLNLLLSEAFYTG